MQNHKIEQLQQTIFEAVDQERNVLVVGRGFWFSFFTHLIDKKLLDLGAFKTPGPFWRFEHSWVAAGDLKDQFTPGIRPHLIICIEDKKMETLHDLYQVILPIMEQHPEINVIVEGP